MPRGGPDDGRLPSTASGTVANPAIDTARGSGFALLDNLGRLVLYDNFADGLGGWGYTPTGTRPAIKVRRDDLANGTAGLSPFGPNPVIFRGSAVSNSGIRKSIITPASGLVGLEVGIRSDSGSVSASWLEIRAKIGNTVSAYSFGFRYLPSIAAAQVELSGGWSTVLGFTRGGSGWDWWRFKMVVDPTSGNYDRLVLPGNQLSSLGVAPTTIGIGVDQVQISIDCPSGAAVPSNEYVGYVCLTQDEP